MTHLHQDRKIEQAIDSENKFSGDLTYLRDIHVPLMERDYRNGKGDLKTTANILASNYVLFGRASALESFLKDKGFVEAIADSAALQPEFIRNDARREKVAHRYVTAHAREHIADLIEKSYVNHGLTPNRPVAAGKTGSPTKKLVS